MVGMEATWHSHNIDPNPRTRNIWYSLPFGSAGPSPFSSSALHTSILNAFGQIESHALFVTSHRYHKAIGCQGQAIAKLQKVVRNVFLHNMGRFI